MAKDLVIGQVGCGAFATDQHGPNCVRNPHVAKIKWACDISKEHAEAYAKRFDAEKATSSFEDATTDPEVDIVCIATSHETHVPIIESAAKHGKHIFCEKPMAMDNAQAYKIIRAVRNGGVKLCVDYMRRSAPAVIALKREWLAHKNNPKHQPWRFIDTPHDKLIEEMSTDFFVRVQDESASYRMVHLDPVRGGGLIIGEAVHWLDLACWLFEDDRPIEICAWGSARMRYRIHMKFQSGYQSTVIMTPNGTFDYPKELYEIACDGALFRMEHFVENQYFGRPGPEKETFGLQRDPCVDVGTEGGFEGYMKKHKAMVTQTSGQHDPTRLWPNHGWEEHFDAFIDAVVNNTPVPCDEMAGYRTTLLGYLAIRSIELNKPLPVPEDLWDCYIEL